MKSRDPLFVTMTVMTELEAFPSLKSVVEATDDMDAEHERERVQWLHDGMEPEEVKAVMECREGLRQRGELATIKTASQLAEEKASRL